MGRKLNCSKRKRRIAVQGQHLPKTLTTRQEKARTRKKKVLLREEIRTLMVRAYAYYCNKEMSQRSRNFVSYFYFPDTPDKRNFILTYIGSGIWDSLDTYSIEDLRMVRGWVGSCFYDMQSRYRKKRFFRNSAVIFTTVLLLVGAIFFKYNGS